MNETFEQVVASEGFQKNVLYKSIFNEKNGSSTKTQQRKHKYKQVFIVKFPVIVVVFYVATNLMNTDDYNKKSTIRK